MTGNVYVALLRAVNVSGRRSVPMAALRAGLEALGYRDVRTYLQSGNAVFRAAGGDPATLSAEIRAMIERDFGHDVDVLVLSAGELAWVVSSNPFIDEDGVDAAWLYVTFLFAPSPGAALPEPAPPGTERERAVLAGRAVYLCLPDGYGRTKLNNAYFERALATRATTRNWRTVLALAAMAQDDG